MYFVGLKARPPSRAVAAGQYVERIPHYAPLRAGVRRRARFLSWLLRLFWLKLSQLKLLWGCVKNKDMSAWRLRHLADPLVNDLYVVRFDHLRPEESSGVVYGVLRVKVISSDRMLMQLSKTSYGTVSEIHSAVRQHKTRRECFFRSTLLAMDASQLVAMKRAGTLLSIKRL